MALVPGARLGPYEILSALGAGGMGEVYRARDPKLNRDVAIKVLPEVFILDVDRLARFKREAQVLASLNHANVAAIYGFEESNASPGSGQAAVQALVMELVEGDTLAERIAKEPIPLDEALPIARQIAEALEAAHEQGIIHRDLKPANIKLRPDGTVKVLDFGLAKALAPDAASATAGDLSRSPTITSPAMMTGVGVILGTAAYMSPEQARGKTVDRRADIWAFGCVLYEMLTGKRAFGGDDVSDTLAAILRGEPDWNALPAGTPPSVRRLLRRALAKDRANRVADISIARLEIKDALEPGVEDVAAPRRSPTWMMAGLVIAVVGLLGTIAALGRPRARAEPLWFAIAPPYESFGGPSPAISPDGRQVAFVALNRAGERTLWIRSFTSPVARELAGTNDASLPFWSPDGLSLGFFSERKLKRVAVDGGSPQILADAPSHRGGTWNADGVIVFAPLGGDVLYRISASGGPATKVTTLDPSRGEQEHLSPHFLPDGRHFLYTIRLTNERASGAYVGSLDSKDSRMVATMRSRAEYAGGYLFFGRDDNLFAQPFDLAKLEIAGEPQRIADRVGVSSGNMTSYAFSTSAAGTLVVWSGWDSPVTQLTMLDRTGAQIARIGDPAEMYGIALAPDGRHVVSEARDPRTNTVDLWLSDLSTGLRSRFTSGDRTWSGSPVWSPDSKRILFTDFADDYQIRAIQGGLIERWPHKIKSRGGWPIGWSG